jgi:L-lactate dehydrogenase complex protein LldF
MGIEKVIPRFTDLEVFLQLLPRSSTAERMNPYTSMWTGVHPGDGPQDFHLVLLDNGRTSVLADEVGRAALHCIRCSACLNVCPVYERTGGHAYGSTYPGPIGAILSPQLTGSRGGEDPNATLPFASSLCGACFDACPVRIDIPSILVHLRAQQVEGRGNPLQRLAMNVARWFMMSPTRFAAAESALSSGLSGSNSWLRGRLPWPATRWTVSREIPLPPDETFRQWWSRTHE